MVERRKKNKTGDDDKSASQKPGPALRVGLPGDLYQRAGRWWWRVKLPGEEKAKARPLKPRGARTATDDRQSAESIAVGMWEQAVAESAIRQIQWESTEKIERLKAQFLDKVRHFTELVETANAKIEAEAAARAEVEAKLAQMQGQDGPEGRHGQNGPSGPCDPSGASTPSTASTPSSCPEGESAPSGPEPAAQNEPAATPTPVGPDPNDGPAPPAAPAVAGDTAAPRPLETGVCDCCGATGIAMTCLKRIESGQSLCPRCLAALQDDIARIAP